MLQTKATTNFVAKLCPYKCMYKHEVPSWTFESRLLPPMPHKHLYLWSDHHTCGCKGIRLGLWSGPQQMVNYVESLPRFGLGTILGLLVQSLTCIGLYTRLQVRSLGTAWECVRHLRPLDLWAGFHYVFLSNIQIKKLLKEL